MDKSRIEQNLNNVLKETNFPGLGTPKKGKVRDVYVQNDRIILISTDRHSSFDRIIAHIPFKGQVLTQTSAWWFEQTADIVPNHVLAIPDPNVVVGKKCATIPIEMVVRGYLTGVTDTAIWTRYQHGERNFGGVLLPDGMKKNQRLPQPLLTPTTKSETHDRNVTPKDIIEEGLADETTWEELSVTALRLFTRGQELARARGLILVDTKYEFGRDEHGSLTLIDEIHTPDSSRWWNSDSYDTRFNEGLEPEYFDKEFLRIWFRRHCDPYKDATLPAAPTDMIVELASRYIRIYEQLTGTQFTINPRPIKQRIKENLQKVDFPVM
ncbi:MAG: Phosphoribosylaminoimidazole-succinocarboxamide synthase [Candidatus Magasanikbacteria bacterium GW2011_GWA2_50_22]|uniref:Phosphoribosylaminoimidazole-succinocarboxamide synthase n=1 Tax=Candidatus Magasanikbacteria bacterium GW2011_GWA2_50_22 TaxID=1619043 RepID=A0A0G1ZDS1_9BACT|nr:MAG: Phosphoribosylaminoimidazole-succinocarboxamide synthase [Candidatus Magasanikbacteria bacterium GW2011_GWA2_50_22]